MTTALPPRKTLLAGLALALACACGTDDGDGASAAGGAGAGGGGSECTDRCAVASGVEYGCQRRFVYGINYAWRNFGADFGGIVPWSQPGVSGSRAEVSRDLGTMASQGFNVVRWWVWPDFRGDAVQFEGSRATGLGGTAIADLEAALELADQNDIYLELTLFSFDGFRPDRVGEDLTTEGMRPILRDPELRSALLENALRPFVRAAEASPYARRLHSWDVINEPEWAITGASLYGDPAFTPNPDLEAVTHEEMESFVKDVIQVLREESTALITVGGAAMKWKRTWAMVDTDFHSLHTYDWVNQYWPYDRSPAEYGVTDKPLVMGEFPAPGLTGVPYGQLLDSWFADGYAGALAWAFTDPQGTYAYDAAAVKDFADSHACEVRYTE